MSSTALTFVDTLQQYILSSSTHRDLHHFQVPPSTSTFPSPGVSRHETPDKSLLFMNPNMQLGLIPFQYFDQSLQSPLASLQALDGWTSNYRSILSNSSQL